MLRDKEHLLDILEAAKIALVYAGKKTKEHFLDDLQCQDAVIRRLEIIGEASRRISEETKAAFPDLPWSGMINMRNVMIHEYDDVDLVIVWETVKNNLPPLIDALQKILKP
jgi:uncharacterized protein with HEPN domain